MSWGSTFIREAAYAFVHQLTKRVRSNINQEGFTDAQVTQAVDTTGQLNQCKPITEDLDHNLIDSICSKLKKSNELEARLEIDRARTELARPWCIDALKAAATLICTCGPTVVKGATFNLLGC